jgi:hypothetical protein
MKTFLVIGSNCFTGSHVVDALLENPENRVLGTNFIRGVANQSSRLSSKLEWGLSKATVVKLDQVLVWGATPTDANPLFKLAGGAGPKAGEFREAVKQALRIRLGPKKLQVLFSEEAEKYSHHRDNPGFYESRQLRDSRMVLLLLPGNRAMAVNTWELALACETKPSSHEPSHSALPAFVLPKAVFDYLSAAMKAGVKDPANFVWAGGASEPVLGAQNSFAARWIYLSAAEKFAAAKESGSPELVLAIIWYPDDQPWDVDTDLGKQIVGKIANFADFHLDELLGPS